MKLLAIAKKEFARFFRDRRMVISMLIPGLLIFILYSVMGSALWDEEEHYQFRVYLSGESLATEQITSLAAASDWSVEYLPAEDIAAAEAAVEEGEATALVVFSPGFDEAVLAYDGGTAGATVEIVYNSSAEDSFAFYTLASNVLSNYRQAFYVLPSDRADETSLFSSLLGDVLPFLIVTLLFSSAMSITLESIAGEKERGTLATILVTPIKRSHLAFGKVLPLAGISLIGAISSFLGVMFSMPKLVGMSLSGLVGGYGFVSYLLLFLLILSIVPVIVSAIAAVSTAARSVKEASGYTSVLMIVVMLLSIVTGFVGEMGPWVFFVPILNAVAGMQAVLYMSISLWQALAAVAVNLVFSVLLVFLIARMLSSERIMFGK